MSLRRRRFSAARIQRRHKRLLAAAAASEMAAPSSPVITGADSTAPEDSTASKDGRRTPLSFLLGMAIFAVAWFTPFSLSFMSSGFAENGVVRTCITGGIENLIGGGLMLLIAMIYFLRTDVVIRKTALFTALYFAVALGGLFLIYDGYIQLPADCTNMLHLKRVVTP